MVRCLASRQWALAAEVRAPGCVREGLQEVPQPLPQSRGVDLKRQAAAARPGLQGMGRGGGGGWVVRAYQLQDEWRSPCSSWRIICGLTTCIFFGSLIFGR